MSKMKHLLRKLHIGGGGLHEHHRLGETRPGMSPNLAPSPSPSPSPSASPSPISAPSPNPLPLPEPPQPQVVGGVAVGSDGAADFNFLEEEFQVQLALAISASSADQVEALEDADESAQIDVAKRMSLGCTATGAAVADSNALVEFLSLQYWSYNVINYDEKVIDGFYDVYGIKSDVVLQGKMPLLVDLQAISATDNVDYEVILVNRLVDPELQRLEKMAIALSTECQASQHGLLLSALVQRIADMVVNRMGGPVGDADEMVKKWNTRSYQLRMSLNTIILPLGTLDVGLSRHRALLFKVLADRIDIPCKLVKGSYYTGTDEGAVNLIKIDTGFGRCSEYIIDLMGAPGTLIPTEVSSNCLQSPDPEVRTFARVSSNLPERGTQTLALGPNLEGSPHIGSWKPRKTSHTNSSTEEDESILAERNQTERFENDFGKLLPSLHKPFEGFSSIRGEAAQSQKVKVKNVSKYVISAAKNPEFAQKLHAVLLESGASPPPDLFSDTYSQDLGEEKARQRRYKQCLPSTAGSAESTCYPCDSEIHATGLVEKLVKLDRNDAAISDYSLCSSSKATSEGFVLVNSGFANMTQTEPSILGGRYLDEDAVSSSKSGERTSSPHVISCNGHSETIDPVLGEAAECDIKWEDLHIGERIGIGSYGEVYRAEWNGTAVAVKKFLDQDFSGDALAQFRCEVEIMLRLRHPNVVLFMGAVTQSPHFSILTEFLPRGSLYRLLHRPNPHLDERRRMRMALDVAKGMNYLHTSNPIIVHRDLKSPNLLVDKNWVVKVCDFGLSRMKHHTFLSSKSTAGTPEWMAPEVLRNEPANEKCDVYSFGVILWELTTMSIPWKGLNPMQVVGAVGFQNRRLEIPEDVDPAVGQIIQDCWQTDPNLRPSFTQLMYRLRLLQRLVVDKRNSTN